MNPELNPTKAAGDAAEKPVASPKLRDEFHAAARLRHLAARTEEAYWDWVVRWAYNVVQRIPKRRRRDIFVVSQNKNEFSPVGAAYFAPDGA